MHIHSTNPPRATFEHSIIYLLSLSLLTTFVFFSSFLSDWLELIGFLGIYRLIFLSFPLTQSFLYFFLLFSRDLCCYLTFLVKWMVFEKSLLCRPLVWTVTADELAPTFNQGHCVWLIDEAPWTAPLTFSLVSLDMQPSVVSLFNGNQISFCAKRHRSTCNFPKNSSGNLQ